ncbi:MAG: hypothetical protein ACOVPA_20385 [Rubrivivax sp.]
MTTQHKALELAGLLNKEVWPAHMTIHKWADEAAAELRAQHALIVQMREALNSLDGLRGPFPPSDEEIGAAWDKAGKTIAAADKYLGEKQ